MLQLSLFSFLSFFSLFLSFVSSHFTRVHDYLLEIDNQDIVEEVKSARVFGEWRDYRTVSQNQKKPLNRRKSGFSLEKQYDALQKIE